MPVKWKSEGHAENKLVFKIRWQLADTVDSKDKHSVNIFVNTA